MKKIFFLLFLVVSSYLTYSQELSYGITGGVDIYEINTKEGVFSSNRDEHLNTNLGLFGKYSFSEKIGLKMNMLLNFSEEKYTAKANKHSGIGGVVYTFTYLGKNFIFMPTQYKHLEDLPEEKEFSLKHKKSQIHLSPLLYYNLESEKEDNQKRLYLLGGPRISFLLNAHNNSINDISAQLGNNNWIGGEKVNVKDFYSTVNLGVQLGAGVNFLKYFSFELIGDYGFTDTLRKNNTTATTIGVFGLLSIDIPALI